MKNRKSLGQHWLKDRTILDAIAGLGLDQDKLTTNTPPHCLEIGPGLGTLTSSLLKRYAGVTAVELDDRLAANLVKSFPGTNLTVKNCNFLDFDLNSLPADYVAIGNIPYYITSPIIHKLLTSSHPPARIVLLMQLEVALRIVAKDGKHSALSLTVANFADTSLAFNVDAEFFTPPPKVDSAVVVFTPHPPRYDSILFNLIRRGFSSPRKKLIHNLSPFFSKDSLLSAFEELKLSTSARPADLDLDIWHQLFCQLKEKTRSSSKRV